MPATSEPSSPLTLDEASAEFLVGVRAGKPSPHTVAAYEADLRLVRMHLATDPSSLTLADLTSPRLRAAFATYADTHAKTSVARAWSTWNRFCVTLCVDGHLPANPMAAVPRPRRPRSAPQAFSDSDIRDLVDTLAAEAVPARYPWPARDYAIITTLAVSGLRRAELLALTIDDIEGTPGARQIAVRHGKGDKYRAVPAGIELENVIKVYLAQRWTRFPTKGRAHPDDPWSAPPRAPLWVSDKGQPMNANQLAHLVKRAYRAAGINSRRPPGALVHALRHTFATSLIENGASVVEVQQLLGHASLATTQAYLTTRPEHLRSAVAGNPVYSQLRRP